MSLRGMCVVSHIASRMCLRTDIQYDLCSDLVPKITCLVGKPGLSHALASNTLLVPSRLAFLQRSASGTVLPAA